MTEILDIPWRMTKLYNAASDEEGTLGTFCVSWETQRRIVIQAAPDVIGDAARQLTNLFLRLRSKATSGYGGTPVSAILDSAVQVDALQSRALVWLSSVDPMPAVSLDADGAEALATKLLDAAKLLRESPKGQSH